LRCLHLVDPSSNALTVLFPVALDLLPMRLCLIPGRLCLGAQLGGVIVGVLARLVDLRF